MSLRIAAVAMAVILVSFSPATAQRGAPGGQWPAYGGDHGSTKYSPVDQIDGDNVSRLRVAWRWESPDNPIVTANRRTLPAIPDAFKSTPVLVDGVLYIKTSLSQAAAIDAATGETLWTFDPGSWEGERPANTGFNSRGVAYWSDGRDARIFLPTGNAYLWALDARTGRPIADFGADGAIDATQGLRRPIPRRDYQLMSVPIVVGDVVVIGSVVFDGPRFQLDAPGDVRGFDVRTGEELWEFHTIPQPGEFGNETWENGSWEYSGSTNAWGMLTADPELGYVYLPIGTPTNDYYGGHRLGDNLFAESIVCLDAATGERVWHFQFVHHGLWDYDATAAPALVDIEVDGRPIKAVAVVTKQAYTYVFDRVTGEPVWPIEERPVPEGDVPGEWYSPTQPFPTKPPAYDRQGASIDDLIDFTPELRAEAVELVSRYKLGPMFTPPVVSRPEGPIATLGLGAGSGGTNWPGGGYDPETHILYVPSRTGFYSWELIPSPGPDVSDMRYVKGPAKYGVGHGGLRDLEVQGLPLVKPPYGRLSAIDLDRGDILWQRPHGETPDAVKNHPALADLEFPRTGEPCTHLIGPLVTATLIVMGECGFHRTSAGRGAMLRAYDKATGDEVGAVLMPAPQSGSPMTYLAGGRQYIVLAVSGRGYPSEYLAFRLPS